MPFTLCARCAGDNTYGQLGVQPAGEMVTVAKPIQNAVRWASVSTSGHHSVAIGSDGKVYAWGLNSDGQLGRGDTESSFSADPEEVRPRCFCCVLT